MNMTIYLILTLSLMTTSSPSMIFIFISCLVSIIAFIFLIFLCYKHGKLRKIISYYLITSNAVEAATDISMVTSGSYILIYLLTAICLTLLLYIILKVLVKWYKQSHRYHTIIPFHRMQGHEKGPLKTIAIELSNLSEIVNVQIAQVKIPITLLSVQKP